MSDNSKVINRYLAEVSDCLKCPRSVRKVFLRELRLQVKDFAANKENLSVEALCSQFGSPEEISNGFVTRDDYQILLRKAKRRTVILAVVAAVAVAIAIFTAVLMKLVIDSYTNRGYMTIEYGDATILYSEGEEENITALESRLAEESTNEPVDITN